MKRILLSVLFTCGVLSAQADVFQYSLTLSAAPGVTTAGTGSGSLIYDNVAHTLSLNVSWTGLTGNTTVSHIHGPTANPFVIGAGAGVVLTPTTLPSFPSGVTSGTYSTVLDMTSASTYPAAYITANGGTPAGAEAAIMGAMAQGRTYWNIHTSFAGGGEINGFPTPVPEPSTLVLAGLGVVGLAARAWSKRRANRLSDSSW